VCDDGDFLHSEPLQQRAPLRHEYGGNDQHERFALLKGDGKRDVRLAQPDLVREQRATVASDDGGQAFGGRDLMRREPRRPRDGRRSRDQRCAVEQRPRGAADDLSRRRFPRRLERDGEGFRHGDEVLRQDPWPARGDRTHRDGGRQRRGHQRVHRTCRAARAQPRRPTRRAAPGGRARRSH